MLPLVAILLVTIILLLCTPQEERGRALVRMLGFAALAMAIYYIGPPLLGAGMVLGYFIWRSEAVRSIVAFLWQLCPWVFCGIVILVMVALLGMELAALWKRFRANPKQELLRFAIWMSKLLRCSLGACLYVISTIYVINRFGSAGLLAYLVASAIATISLVVWHRRRKVETA